jgi:hypothetical protein
MTEALFQASCSMNLSDGSGAAPLSAQRACLESVAESTATVQASCDNSLERAPLRSPGPYPFELD